MIAWKARKPVQESEPHSGGQRVSSRVLVLWLFQASARLWQQGGSRPRRSERSLEELLAALSVRSLKPALPKRMPRFTPKACAAGARSYRRGYRTANELVMKRSLIKAR